MELELKKTSLDVWEAGGEWTLTQEETAETIVPDYCPDIARIIETEGTVYLHSRELRDGNAVVSGNVRVCVLYTPEKEGGIRTLEFAVPFTFESDGRGLAGCQSFTADVTVESLESRMLNPRKLFTHCRLSAALQGYRRVNLEVCEDLDAPEDLGVEKRRESQRIICLRQTAEKDFTFSEAITLSPGREGAAEILRSQVECSVTETKTVGAKLIFKGMFRVWLLYRTAQGQCCAWTTELPFSQIMELDGEAENAEVDLRICLTGIDIQIDGEDPEGRQMDVTVYFHATALVYQEQELMLLRDFYSTAYETAYEACPMEFLHMRETLHRRQTIREVLEIGTAAESVLAAHAHCGPVQVSRGGGSVTLRSGITVRVLYLDEGGVPLLAERRLEASCQMEVPETVQVRGTAACTEELQVSLGDRGIEVRFPVDFRAEATDRAKRVCISSARLDREAPSTSAGAPSLVLRCLGRQESAWDLAKAYRTTIADILSANQLEGESAIPREKLLLIPRKRT